MVEERNVINLRVRDSVFLCLRACFAILPYNVTLIKNAFRNTHLRKVFEGQEAKNWTLRSRKK